MSIKYHNLNIGVTLSDGHAGSTNVLSGASNPSSSIGDNGSIFLQHYTLEDSGDGWFAKPGYICASAEDIGIVNGRHYYKIDSNPAIVIFCMNGNYMQPHLASTIASACSYQTNDGGGPWNYDYTYTINGTVWYFFSGNYGFRDATVVTDYPVVTSETFDFNTQANAERFLEIAGVSTVQQTPIGSTYAKVSGAWQDLIGTDINDINLGGCEQIVAFAQVTYHPGRICTATNGVITLTAPDISGNWIVAIPATGVWTFSDGVGTESITVSYGNSYIISINYYVVSNQFSGTVYVEEVWNLAHTYKALKWWFDDVSVTSPNGNSFVEPLLSIRPSGNRPNGHGWNAFCYGSDKTTRVGDLVIYNGILRLIKVNKSAWITGSNLHAIIYLPHPDYASSFVETDFTTLGGEEGDTQENLYTDPSGNGDVGESDYYNEHLFLDMPYTAWVENNNVCSVTVDSALKKVSFGYTSGAYIGQRFGWQGIFYPGAATLLHYKITTGATSYDQSLRFAPGIGILPYTLLTSAVINHEEYGAVTNVGSFLKYAYTTQYNDIVEETFDLTDITTPYILIVFGAGWNAEFSEITFT